MISTSNCVVAENEVRLDGPPFLNRERFRVLDLPGNRLRFVVNAGLRRAPSCVNCSDHVILSVVNNGFAGRQFNSSQGASTAREIASAFART
jgi:hypothetical protein